MSHPTKRCDNCEFWDLDDQWDESHNEGRHPDDYVGNCHRNAPRPTMGNFEYEILKHITIVTWKHATEEEKEREFKNWEEAYLGEVSWPSTKASDWCGEWLQRIIT